MNKLKFGGVVFLLACGGFILAQKTHQTQFSITVVEPEVLKPMGFMLTPASPEGVKSGGVPVGVQTDFFGLPVDPEHPSMGAIQWHEPTPEYQSLVKLILAERSGNFTLLQRDELNKKIDSLFLSVYGITRSEFRAGKKVVKQ